MSVLSDRQSVELFHLHFVRLLCAGADRDRFAIKGGCNLRFFFDSMRYSEDIDFDVAGIPVHVLKEKLNKVLGGPALAMPLKSRGISIGAVTAPKQTDTTQMMPVLAPHYPLAAALRQKVGALIGRSTVQARDIFDLAVLLSKAGGRIDALRPMRAQIPKAIDRAMDVSYGDFKAQVASYLKPEHLDEYGTRRGWKSLQAQVVDALEKAAA